MPCSRINSPQQTYKSTHPRQGPKMKYRRDLLFSLSNDSSENSADYTPSHVRYAGKTHKFPNKKIVQEQYVERTKKHGKAENFANEIFSLAFNLSCL